MHHSPALASFPTSRDWEARWIWHPHAPDRNAWVLFRNEFSVDHIEGAKLFVSADTRYRVWVNGTLLGDGPPQSQPYHQYYDERDITGVLKPGRNSMAVVVHHQGVQHAARGGLLAEVEDGRGGSCCATGEHWQTLLGTAWRRHTRFSGGNKIGPFQEQVDLRAIPVGWQQVGFNAKDWTSAIEIGGRASKRVPLVMPWCRMVPRDIAFIDERNIYAESIYAAEECLDLATRANPGDLSISLSQAGRPLEWATIEQDESLLQADGETQLACSSRHRDGVTDGRYDPCITLDFGRVLTGYAEVEVVSPDGAHLEIGYAERLIDGQFNNAIECPFADRAIFAEGSNTFRPLVWRSFRYLRIRLKNCEIPLRVHAVRAVEVRYPYTLRGAYNGDPRMEQVFEICRTTLELCSIESLMDTPFREQAQWLGDVAAVTVPGIYACFGDTRLPGKFIRQAAMNTRPTGLLANISNVADPSWQNDIPDYSLWWVMGLWRHYQYTGEKRYLHECYPEMQRIMRVHLERINQDGLLDPMFGWLFIDWAHVDTDGLCAPYNAIFAGACDAAAAVAEVKGDRWAQEVYTAAAAGIRKAFATAFLDPESGVVVDAVKDGIFSERRSEQGNAAAIAFGCVDDTQADCIIEKVFDNCTTNTTEAQPFFMVVVLQALRRRGRVDLALRLIEERWGQRMVDRGRTSCTEEWYENGSWRSGDWSGFERTHSHAWSGCAAEFLITGLAGIEIIEPGCRKLRIQPFASEIPYQVVYPTPSGDVRVTWDGTAAQIEAPEGVAVVSGADD